MNATNALYDKTCYQVDGRRLRSLLSVKAVKQKTVAQKVGVTKFTVSRWCSDSMQRVKHAHAESLADALGMDIAGLLQHCGVSSQPVLTDTEAEWLSVFRRLSPLDKARVRVEVERIVQNLSPAEA